MKHITIQSLADELRFMEKRSCWPGKPMGAPAETKYPNLLAECVGSNRFMCSFAGAAGVSDKIMAAVLEDGEELTETEIRRVSMVCAAPLGCVTAVKLQTVDPSTNKGKRRRRELNDLIDEAGAIPVRGRWQVDRVRSRLNSGESVTYSAYSWARYLIEDAIEDAKQTVAIRTVRRTA